tara:strand:- start:118 stop:459 length:342 start_codon:yes stop_codon:yes gene_type:complete
MNKDNETTIIDIDTFNNKGQKGDDDFETWLANEAPFVPEDPTTGTFGEGSATYTVDVSQNATGYGHGMGGTVGGLSPTFTIKDSPHFAQTKQKKLPIDILHKWYPEEMKVDND